MISSLACCPKSVALPRAAVAFAAAVAAATAATKPACSSLTRKVKCVFNRSMQHNSFERQWCGQVCSNILRTFWLEKLAIFWLGPQWCRKSLFRYALNALRASTANLPRASVVPEKFVPMLPQCTARKNKRNSVAGFSGAGKVCSSTPCLNPCLNPCFDLTPGLDPICLPLAPSRNPPLLYSAVI